MVGLVLKAAGQLAGAGQLDEIAIPVLTTTDGGVRAGELGIAAGQRQATFVPGLQVAIAALADLDRRVADDPDLTAQVSVDAVEDESRPVDPDLRGGEPGAGGGDVGGEHVAQQRLQVIAKASDRPGRGVQDRIGSPQRTRVRAVPGRVNWSIGMKRSSPGTIRWGGGDAKNALGATRCRDDAARRP